jgi:peptidoglycan/LPS O-acetylase OafA/YrhL
VTATTPRDAGAARRLGHVPALDGVRGLAVAIVVVHHVKVPGIHGGWLGVDVFFTLSGFLITLSVLSISGEGGLRRFFSRRFWRIAPAMAALLAWYLAVSLGASDRGRRLEYLGAAAGQFINVQAAGYRRGPFSEHLGHLWSLSAEAQFYVVWPLVLVALLRWRTPRWVVLAVPVCLFVGSTVLRHVLVDQGMQWNRVYFGPDTHAGPLFAGAVVGVLFAWRVFDRRPVLVTAATALALPAMAVLAWVVVTPSMYFVLPDGLRWGITLAAVGGAVLVAAAATASGGPLRPLLTLAPVAWLGRISYSVYLWHVPLIAELVRRHPDLSAAGRAAVVIPASLLLGWLSYTLVERPLMSPGGRARLRGRFAG